MRDQETAAYHVKDNLKGGGNHFYKNTKNHYNEITKEAGLHTGLISFGLGVSIGDVNERSIS